MSMPIAPVLSFKIALGTAPKRRIEKRTAGICSKAALAFEAHRFAIIAIVASRILNDHLPVHANGNIPLMVIGPGGVIDAAHSTAGTGSISTNF
jgi:hypothetical protein